MEARWDLHLAEQTLPRILLRDHIRTTQQVLLRRADFEHRIAWRCPAAQGLVEEREASLRELRTSGVRVLDALPAEAAAPLLAAWLALRRGG